MPVTSVVKRLNRSDAQSVVLDTRGEEVDIVDTHEGDSPGDRREISTLLGEIENLQETFVYDCSLVDC